LWCTGTETATQSYVKPGEETYKEHILNHKLLIVFMKQPSRQSENFVSLDSE